jgi:hypothetical protein
MAPAISINLLAIVSFALFYVSLTPIAANALSVERAHVARNFNHAAHAGIAKKKRDGPSKRCKPRPSSSTPPPSSTPANTPAYTPPSTPTPTPGPTDLPTTSYSSTGTPSSSPPPTTSSSSSPTPTSGSSGVGKLGIGWSNGEETSLCNFVKAGLTTIVYNWQSGGYGDIVDPSSCGLTYMPICWGPNDLPGCINDISKLSPRHIGWFNEPDQGTQSNTDVGTAVGLWFQYFEQFKNQGYTLVSPACTNSPDGFKWIQDFVSQVKQQGGSVDIVATHIYSTDLSYSISFLESFIAAFPGSPIWVTEYACQDYSGANLQLDNNGVVAYMTGLSNWMYENSAIELYAPFAFFTASELQANNVNPDNALIGDNDEPTQLGYDILNPS